MGLKLGAPTPRKSPCHYFTQPLSSQKDPLKGGVNRPGAQSLGTPSAPDNQGPPRLVPTQTDKTEMSRQNWIIFISWRPWWGC